MWCVHKPALTGPYGTGTKGYLLFVWMDILLHIQLSSVYPWVSEDMISYKYPASA